MRLAPIDDDYRPAIDVMFGQLLGVFLSLQWNLQPDRPSPNGAISRVVTKRQHFICEGRNKIRRRNRREKTATTWKANGGPYAIDSATFLVHSSGMVSSEASQLSRSHKAVIGHNSAAWSPMPPGQSLRMRP